MPSRAPKGITSAAVAKADHLADHFTVVAGDDIAAVADGEIVLHARDLDQEALDRGNLAEHMVGGDSVDFAQ